MNSTTTQLTPWDGMDSGSLARVTMLLMILILEMLVKVTVMVREHKLELVLSQPGTTREDLKLLVAQTSDLKTRHIWTMTLLVMKSSLPRVLMEKKVLEFIILSLLGIQKFLI